MDIWIDLFQCMEKEDEGGILDFGSEQWICEKSNIFEEYGRGKIKSLFWDIQDCGAFWTFV